MVTSWRGNLNLRAMDSCKGKSRKQSMAKGSTMKAQVIIVDDVVDGVDVMVGMDMIVQLGGKTVGEKGVEFGNRCTVC